MKHKAYQIVNFKDPLSVRYFEHSQRSLRLIEDVLDVEPVQCVTPEEVDDYNWPWKTDGDKGRNRSIYEKACFLSHINLIKRLKDKEKFFVLEHDVYVWPEEKKLIVLYDLLSRANKFAALYPGISNEFYTMDSVVASSWLNLARNQNHDYGPLAVSLEVLRHFYNKKKLRENTVVWPIATLDNRIGISNNVIDIAYDRVEGIPAPITQHYILSEGATIRKRATTWKVTKENNPNFYFTED